MSRGKPPPLLVIAIFGVFVLVVAGAFVSSSGAFDSAPSPASHRTATPSSPTDSASPQPSTATPTATRTSVPSTPVATPSPLVGLRYWVGGDSMAAYLANNLVSDLKAEGVTSATADWKISSGLSRPDYFDWIAELKHVIATENPQVMVFMVGANDAQGITTPTGQAVAITPFSPQWIAAYSQRVNEAMDLLSGDGRIAIWVAMPIMQDPSFNARMEQINAIDKAAAATHPGVTYMDDASLFAVNGRFSLTDPGPNGTPVQVRASDGVHLTAAGGQLLAQDVIATLEAFLTSLHP